MQFYVKSTPDHGEKEIPLTGPILPEIIRWASAEYHNYPFGNLLRQSYLNAFTGFHKYLADLNEGATVYPACTQPTIALQFMIEGHASCQMKGGKRATLQEGRVALFYLPKGRNRGIISPGRFHSIHFELNPNFLREMAAGTIDADQAIALAAEGYSSGVQFSSVPINYIMYNRLNRLPFLTVDDLEANLKIILNQLMNSFKNGIRDAEYLESINNSDESNKLISIRNTILSAPNVHLHTSRLFSSKSKLSERKIRSGFRNYFGIELRDFVLTHVMQNALDLLKASRLSITEIAQHVGYKDQYQFLEEFQKIHHFIRTS